MSIKHEMFFYQVLFIYLFITAQTLVIYIHMWNGDCFGANREQDMENPEWSDYKMFSTHIL